MILGIRRARRAFALCSIPAIGLWVGLVAVSVLFHAPAEGVAAFLVTSAIGRVLAIAQAVGVVASFLSCRSGWICRPEPRWSPPWVGCSRWS
jgi:hypothetical protein